MIQDEPARHAAPLQLALTSQARFWPNPRIDTGPIGAGWTSAADLFANSAAIDDLLAYQKSFTLDLDRKGQAAYAIGEYSHMFAITAAAPFVGFGLVPDLSPCNYALAYDTRALQHNGRTVEERLPRVRFLNVTVSTENQAFAGHADVLEIVDRATLCERLRRQVEVHFEPLIAALHAKSGLSRNALWRLVGDSLSQRFLDAGERYQRTESAKAAALAVLKHDGSPLSNRQMHYFDIDIRDDKHPEQVLLSRTYRARGGCCRFYTVEGGHLCSSCVLQDAQQRVINIERKLRRRLGLPARDVDTSVAKSNAPV